MKRHCQTAATCLGIVGLGLVARHDRANLRIKNDNFRLFIVFFSVLGQFPIKRAISGGGAIPDGKKGLPLLKVADADSACLSMTGPGVYIIRPVLKIS